MSHGSAWKSRELWNSSGSNFSVMLARSAKNSQNVAILTSRNTHFDACTSTHAAGHSQTHGPERAIKRGWPFVFGCNSRMHLLRQRHSRILPSRLILKHNRAYRQIDRKQRTLLHVPLISNDVSFLHLLMFLAHGCTCDFKSSALLAGPCDKSQTKNK